MDFPSIRQPSYSMEVIPEDTSIISPFEDGSQQSRQRFTRSRRKFKVKWEKLPDADYRTLMDFIVHGCKFKALPFNWNNPQKKPDGTTETLEVRATDGFDSWKLVTVNYWDGELELTEV